MKFLKNIFNCINKTSLKHIDDSTDGLIKPFFVVVNI